jgi:predicted phosphodiesterase
MVSSRKGVMRVLVISDIHANLTALEAVLKEADGVDATWCLGDIVGYGPDPNQCIARIRGLPNLVCLLGNHDAAALGKIDVDAFNAEARVSVQWMQSELSEESQAFLKDLPEKITLENITLTHGSPRNPVWEYILDLRIAQINFSFFDTPFCFIGHTHLPVIYRMVSDYAAVRMMVPAPGETVVLKPRGLLNPGSVGQPRDRDARAAYAIFDTKTSSWEYHRVAYDVASVQKRIYDANLPPRHAIRLAEGW